MPLPSTQPVVAAYRVEVSGWDQAHSFFVEKAELAWSEATGKQIFLNRSLRPGSIVFVRLLNSYSPERSGSVAYEANFIATTPAGCRQFQLQEVHPRREK